MEGWKRRRREWPPSLNEISHSRLIREISPWNEFHDSSVMILGRIRKKWHRSGQLRSRQFISDGIVDICFTGEFSLVMVLCRFLGNLFVPIGLLSRKLDGYLSCVLDTCLRFGGNEKYKTRDRCCFIFLTLKFVR